jgi:mannitol/fructose-specific phosphotransferase system IIA component (Ntr-type)
MKLKDFLPEGHIIADLKGVTKVDVIQELLMKMENLSLLNDYELAFSDIMSREGYLSTGLENGLAIPHAKTDGIENLTLTFGLKKTGVEFESLDQKPAQLIFLVLSPRDVSGPHIHALALIARNLKESTIRQKLMNAISAAEIASIFESFN